MGFASHDNSLQPFRKLRLAGSWGRCWGGLGAVGIGALPDEGL